MKDHIHQILEINENVPKTFCSDEKRIKQIILNLITNSINFTRRGYIIISAKITVENFLLISVENTGIGIQASYISNIFKESFKLEFENEFSNDKNKKEQEILHKTEAGLGLSIMRNITEEIGEKDSI